MNGSLGPINCRSSVTFSRAGSVARPYGRLQTYVAELGDGTLEVGIEKARAPWLVVGCVLAGTAVALGAFGAHALESRLADQADAAKLLGSWETGVRYQFYHSLALIVVSLLWANRSCRWLTISAVLFCVGIVLFSGCLYLWVLTQASLRPLVWFVPLGGFSFLCGWVCLTVYARRGLRINADLNCK